MRLQCCQWERELVMWHYKMSLWENSLSPLLGLCLTEIVGDTNRSIPASKKWQITKISFLNYFI